MAIDTEKILNIDIDAYLEWNKKGLISRIKESDRVKFNESISNWNKLIKSIGNNKSNLNELSKEDFEAYQKNKEQERREEISQKYSDNIYPFGWNSTLIPKQIDSLNEWRKDKFQEHKELYLDFVEIRKDKKKTASEYLANFIEGKELTILHFFDSPRRPLPNTDIQTLMNFADQFAIIDFIQFLSSELERYNSSELAPLSNFSKLKFKRKKIDLVTLFYDLHQIDVIEADKSDIIKMISSCFIDSNGKPFTYSYVEKLMKDKEPKAKNPIDVRNWG